MSIQILTGKRKEITLPSYQKKVSCFTTLFLCCISSAMAPFNRRIVTLRNIDDTPQDPSESNPFETTFCQPTSNIPLLLHILHLPLADSCCQMLERIWQEFQPIIHRRGFHIESISELCCCGDGLDFRRGRTLRTNVDNVLGYNQTIFVRRGGGAGALRQTTHTIHLRLRKPQHHATQLLSWEDVAGTMAHELSHCVHQNHSPAFYKLMEEILDEHATNQIQKMGSLIYGAATATSRLQMPTRHGQQLGGTTCGTSRLLETLGSTGARGDIRSLSPRAARREAMARAAEKRCRQIHNEDYNPWRDIKPPARSKGEEILLPSAPNQVPMGTMTLEPPIKSQSSVSQPETIDLTSSDHQASALTQSTDCEWDCYRCTFRNQPLGLICEMCFAERNTLSSCDDKVSEVIEIE